jgi:hypothetical protein
VALRNTFQIGECVVDLYEPGSDLIGVLANGVKLV